MCKAAFFLLLFSSSCVAFSVVEVQLVRVLWWDVKREATTPNGTAPALSIALARKWLSKVRATPELADGDELDAMRQDWRPGLDVAMFRSILKSAYRAAPHLRNSLPAMRLNAFLYLQSGKVKSAQATYSRLIGWCKNPGIKIEGFYADEHCSSGLLSWIADGELALAERTLPRRMARWDQLTECGTTPGVPDLLEFDLAYDTRNSAASARLGLRLIWNALLRGCSLKYAGAALTPLALHGESLRAQALQELQQMDSVNSSDFEFLRDQLPWPVQECDYVRSPTCALGREYTSNAKRRVLQRIVALVDDFSATPAQRERRAQQAEAYFDQAQVALKRHQVHSARSRLARSLRADWRVDTDYALRLMDALSAGAAPPKSVNPRAVKPGWVYEFGWFDEEAFQKHELIYQTLLPAPLFLQLKRRQAWQRVLAQAADIVCGRPSDSLEPQLMPLHGIWHGTHLQIDDLQLPWPEAFDWAEASMIVSLSEKDRVALFARMRVGD